MNKLNIWTIAEPANNGHKKVVEENHDVFDDDEECDKYLKGLNPAEWKEQDHYRCMGLSKKRYHSNENEIKKQCKFILEFKPGFD